MAKTNIEITAVDKTAAAFRSVERSVTGFEANIGRVTRLLGVVAGAAGLGAMIKSQIDLGDQLNKTSQKLGVSVENLSAYQYAAKLSGVSNDQLSGALARLSNNIQEAAINKTSEASRYFAALGISVTDAHGRVRGTDSVWEELAGKLAKAKDGTAKTAYEMKLLGKSGYELTPLINGLHELTAEARATGNIISTDFAMKAELFNDSMERMEQAAGKMARHVAGFVAPRLAEMMERINVIIGAQEKLSSQLNLSDLEKKRAALADRLQEIAALEERGGRIALGVNSQMAADIKQKIEADIAAINRLLEKERQAIAMSASRAKGQGTGATDMPMPEDLMTNAAQKRADVASRGESEWIAKQNSELAERVNRIQQSYMTEAELERVNYERKHYDLILATEQDILTEQQYNGIRERVHLEHLVNMGDMDAKARLDGMRFHNLALSEKVKATVAFGVTELGAVATSNKALFKINKSLALAQIGVAMPSAIGQAIERGGGLPWGAAFGALTAVKMLAQMNAIKSAQYGSATSAPSIGGGRATPVTPAPDFSQVPSLPANQQSELPKRNITIVLRGEGAPSDDYIRNRLIPAINEAIGDGASLQSAT
jgi:hypothetical protein